MSRGRRPLGIPEQIDRLHASPLVKKRLEVMLSNLAGQMTVEESCQVLGLNQSWFFEYRNRTLMRLADALEPDTPGPKPSPPHPETERIAELEEQIRQLQLQLSGARLQLELSRERLAEAPPPPRAKKKENGDRSLVVGVGG